jgi:hypothetical protein
MMKTILSLLILAIALPGYAGVVPGDVAPDFTLLSTKGESFQLSQEQGRIRVLFFMGYS